MSAKIVTLFILLPFAGQSQSLDEAINMAIDRDYLNKSIEKSAISIEEEANFSSKLPDPMVSAGYFILSPETRVGPQQFSISVSQSMPWFGTLTTAEEWKRSMAGLKRAGIDVQANMIADQVASIYFELYKIRETIEILEEARTIFSSVERISTEKTKTGKSGLSDVLQIQMEADEIALKIEQLDIRRQSLEKILNIYTGRDETAKWVVPDTLREPDMEHIFPTDSNNAQLRRLDARRDVLMNKRDHVEKKGTPMVNFGLNYINVGQRSDMNPSDNGKDILMPMIGLSIPINGDAYHSLERSTEIEIESNELEYLEIQEKLKIQWEYLMDKYNQASVDVVSNIELRDKAISTRKILLQAYSVDGKDIEDVLRVERLVLKYKMNIIHGITTMWKTNYSIRSGILSEWNTRSKIQ